MDTDVLKALDRIDDAMHALDVELHPALALRTMGRLIAEVGDTIDTVLTTDPDDNPATKLDDALDLIDSVIRTLEGDEGGESS